MAKNADGTEIIEPVIPPVDPVTVPTDAEKRVKELEDDNRRLVEERTNYQAAYLKEHSKNHQQTDPELEETPEEMTRRVAREVLIDSQITANNKEREDLLTKTLKKNRELELALLNNKPVPTSTNSSTETGTIVQDTLITPEQLAYFKSIGKDDKWIELYRKNLRKNRR